ncbi:late embryogenesis abundant protein, LEA5-type [Artemisia annua]|uniref:Late embryogenesis abundant protein, LEA5-type n=1 Tax=Artemisia annua TaxID=35608 RepID=A0A2U1MU45_ARTAN|nr:late embryogenesis abundant protein, LEA5-type [Artemisia annua]
MANAKLISTLIVDQLYVVARRGIVTATQGSVSGSVRGSGVAMMKKGGEDSTKSSSWVPDPVTGYYKPEGQTNEVDVADQLRELILKQKNRQN